MKTSVLVIVCSLALIACEGNRPPSPEPAAGTTGEPVTTAPPATANVDAAASDGFASAFANESRDTAWAPDQERTLRTAVSKINGAKLQSIDCRTTVCRMEFTFDSLAATETFEDQFYIALNSLTPRRTGGHGGRATSDRLKKIVYVSRAGYAPPAPDGTPRPKHTQAGSP